MFPMDPLGSCARMGTSTRARGATLGALLILACVTLPASSFADPTFGRHDVRTVFYISKSDDRNRVDYGIRLDARCQPRSPRPVYAYWRRFEPDQPRFGDLNLLDRRAYAVARQHVVSTASSGSWIEMYIAAVPELRVLVLAQPGGEGCRARAQVPIRGRPAFLDHIHVQLSGPMSVDHVLLRGEDVARGAPVFERRSP